MLQKFKKSIFFVILTFSISFAHAETVYYRGEKVPDQSGSIITVLGAIDPAVVGTTLMHEHMFADIFPSLEDTDRWEKQTKTRGFRRPETKDDIDLWNETITVRNISSLKHSLNDDFYTLDNTDDAIEEVLAYKELGGKTIVDVTPIDLGRRPEELEKISRMTGVNIVMSTGFYEGAYHPADVDKKTVDDLTHFMVEEIIDGVGKEKIKAGIIGEISTTYLSFQPENNDLRVLRAAAQASQITGAAISLHNHINSNRNNIHVALDVLEKEGLEFNRVIVGHIPGMIPSKGQELATIGFIESILKRGVYVQFDTLGAPYKSRGFNIEDFQVELLIDLIERGYSSQLLISHDMFSKGHLTKFGGYGLSFIDAHLIPYLLQQGIHQYQIDKIRIENPREVLAFSKPKNIERAN